MKVMIMLRIVKDPGRKEKRKNALNSLPALTGLRLGIDASVGPSGRVCYLQ
jgi:hypothetical protein